MSESISDRHSDDEYLDAVREHDPAATSEVADAVGVARQSADYRLRKLEGQGKVASKRIGNSLAWTVIEDVAESTPVDPADTFWEAETYEGAAMSAAAVDEVLYGESETG